MTRKDLSNTSCFIYAGMYIFIHLHTQNYQNVYENNMNKKQQQQRKTNEYDFRNSYISWTMSYIPFIEVPVNYSSIKNSTSSAFCNYVSTPSVFYDNLSANLLPCPLSLMATC